LIYHHKVFEIIYGSINKRDVIMNLLAVAVAAAIGAALEILKQLSKIKK
jgi:hypothetical protein